MFEFDVSVFNGKTNKIKIHNKIDNDDDDTDTNGLATLATLAVHFTEASQARRS